MSLNNLKKKLSLLEQKHESLKSNSDDLSNKDITHVLVELKKRFIECKEYILDKEYVQVQEEINNFIQSCLDNISTIYDLRFICRYNLFFLITLVFKKKFMYRYWTFLMTKECQLNPNGKLQLWSRGHFKTSIWTNGKTIQDVLLSHGMKDKESDVNKDLVNIVYDYLLTNKESNKFDHLLNRFSFKEEACVGIFSATKKLAEAFLIEIKTEFEINSI